MYMVIDVNNTKESVFKVYDYSDCSSHFSGFEDFFDVGKCFVFEKDSNIFAGFVEKIVIVVKLCNKLITFVGGSIE